MYYMTGEIRNALAVQCKLKKILMINWSALSQLIWSNFLRFIIRSIITVFKKLALNVSSFAQKKIKPQNHTNVNFPEPSVVWVIQYLYSFWIPRGKHPLLISFVMLILLSDERKLNSVSKLRLYTHIYIFFYLIY